MTPREYGRMPASNTTRLLGQKPCPWTLGLAHLQLFGRCARRVSRRMRSRTILRGREQVTPHRVADSRAEARNFTGKYVVSFREKRARFVNDNVA